MSQTHAETGKLCFSSYEYGILEKTGDLELVKERYATFFGMFLAFFYIQKI